MNRLDIKGKENATKVMFALFESGYSVLLPHQVSEEQDEEERYYVIEYSLVKYGEPNFILEEE